MNLLDAIYVPAAVVTAPWWARKTRSGWGERFGHIDPLPLKQPGRPRVLLHAVSVGEVGTLRGLVPMLRERGCEVVVSAATDTGLKRAQELFGSQTETVPPPVPLPSAAPNQQTDAGVAPAAEGSADHRESAVHAHDSLPPVHVVRFALDFSPAVRRFLDAVDPDVAALVELEVWPNFIRACGQRAIPIGVINGRLSARSFRGYHRFVRFFRPVFGSLAFAGVQDPDYAQRFRAMGVPEDRLSITGSMKWDALGGPPLRGGSDSALDPIPPTLKAQADQLAQELGIDRTKPLIVAGSTAPIDRVARLSEPGALRLAYDCEEALLHAACPEGVQLLCAPRKPEHFDRAFAALGGEAHCVRRSSRTPGNPGTTRFLLDTIGELRAAYALADIAVIGRTFGSLGGSDPIEPIALGKATIVGPRSTNFQFVVGTFRAADAIVLTDAPDLSTVLRDLLGDPARRAKLASNGAACILRQQGATHRHAEIILAAICAATPRKA